MPDLKHSVAQDPADQLQFRAGQLAALLTVMTTEDFRTWSNEVVEDLRILAADLAVEVRELSRRVHADGIIPAGEGDDD